MYLDGRANRLNRLLAVTMAFWSYIHLIPVHRTSFTNFKRYVTPLVAFSLVTTKVIVTHNILVPITPI
jgi:hypothetical protein